MTRLGRRILRILMRRYYNSECLGMTNRKYWWIAMKDFEDAHCECGGKIISSTDNDEFHNKICSKCYKVRFITRSTLVANG